jgi:hypothetical protein
LSRQTAQLSFNVEARETTMKDKNVESKAFVIPRSKNLQYPVSHKQLFFTLAVAVGFFFSAAVAANSAEVEAAIDLMKQSHIDQCQKIKIKKELLIAHQHHDQAKLQALGPELDAINKRLKPTEDKLTILKSAMMKNPDDESDFATAMLYLDACN